MNPNKSKYNIKDWLSNQNAGGFKDGNTNPSLNDYEYDENDFRVKDFEKVFYEETERSSMIKDRNKGIENITYNHLNLPVEIKWTNNKKINYLYTATGVKVQKTVTNGANIKTTDYLDGFQYNDDVLEFYPHPEGYVKATLLNPNNNKYAYNYVYNYTDHLGNVRVSYTKDPQTGKLKILDESHYYPFGLKHSEYAKYGLIEQNLEVVIAPVTDNPYQYKFGQKEYQDELNLNVYAFGFRDYDPALGRWNVIDQLSEMYHTTSPYAFVQNNPLINREIDGRYFDDKKSAKQADKIERKAEKQANKLDKKADKIDKKGGNSGDLRDRATELRQSAQDVRDMRNDQSTEYKYAKLDGKEGKALGLVGPSTTLTGQNGKGDNVVTMFTEKNMGNQIHETRHGGQNARGEFNIATGANYGVADEVSAYRAQYSWDGNLKFIDPNKNPTQTDIINSMQTGANPWLNTINAINQINANFVNSLVDPGFVPIYPPASIPLNIWNSN